MSRLYGSADLFPDDRDEWPVAACFSPPCRMNLMPRLRYGSTFLSAIRIDIIGQPSMSIPG